MRGRWVVTWVLCGVSLVILTMLGMALGKDAASTASSIIAMAISLFGVLSVWAWRRSGQQGRSTSAQLVQAQDALARLVDRQWRREAGLRQLNSPAPLPVSWSDTSEAGICDHPELVGGTVSCRSDQAEELAAAFRRLPRRRLVVLGTAGSGKTTFAVLLALSLLRTRQDAEPVPVLFTAASFDPAQENVHEWLCRRITADYPTLADVPTYGPSAVDDILASHRVLPVIDGLDELPEEVRAAVLTAFSRVYDTDAPLILTCRTDEYTDAVTATGALAHAVVVEPAGLATQESLRLLRQATAAGLSQQRWSCLADHVNEHPGGAVSEAFSSPLIVALARSVYAEGAGNPDELRDFTSKEAIEDHLLAALVPTVYATARRHDPAGRLWSPEQAHHYLAQIASGMQLRGTTDLAWWQLYNWVPVLSRTWARCGAVGVLLFLLTLVGFATGQALPEFAPEKLGSLEWIPGAVAVALPCMCWLAARIVNRPGPRARRLTGAARTALFGALAFAVVGVTTDRPDDTAPYAYAIACVFFWGFTFVLVLYSAGLPFPPLLPRRGTLTPSNRPRRLLLAVATFLGTTALAVAAFRLYALVVMTPDSPRSRPAPPVELPWTHGLILGALVGALQALLYWTRGTTSEQEVTDPVTTVRADRLVTLVGCCAGLLLVTLPYNLNAVLQLADPAKPGPAYDNVLTAFVCALLGVGPTGLMLAMAAHAWPYYTAARLLLATRGRLPWKLQHFLDDAHRLGILRQVGPLYQFRHARLQEHLARTVHVPGPRNPSSSPDLQPGPASLR
ncbi:NACHT domain-containing protein [Streptomyces phaeochromogenes]|uniref:NACHT domain-containing protein n=2 Tax=Streptomyces phaeochromogenes TaxID=1923 RepID=UPI003250DC9A